MTMIIIIIINTRAQHPYIKTMTFVSKTMCVYMMCKQWECKNTSMDGSTKPGEKNAAGIIAQQKFLVALKSTASSVCTHTHTLNENTCWCGTPQLPRWKFGPKLT